MKSKSFWVVSVYLILISVSQACKNNDILSVKTPTVSAIDCASATFSASATSGASYAATASVPYSGGNGATYEEGTAVASSGVSGLIATLSAGSLTSSTGLASFAITGMPTSAGTAIFPVTLGGQNCTLSLAVIALKATLSTLSGFASPDAGVNGTASQAQQQ